MPLLVALGAMKTMGHEILTLMHKEIIETIREFKSLGLFIGFCAVFFPMFLLFGTTQISAALIEDQISNQRGKIGVKGDIDLVRDVLKEKKELDISPLYDIEPVKSIEDDVYDIVVVVPDSKKTAAGEKPTIDVFYDSHSEGTISWAVEVAAAMSSSQMKMLRTKLKKVGVDSYSNTIPKINYKGISHVEISGAAPLSETLPTVILFFITTVAIGGAIGGITMERENKRLAQLLLLPIKRSSILYSLLLVVSAISLLPVLAGLFSLSWALSLDEIADRLKMHNLTVTVPPETILWILLLTVPIAISVTASSILFSCYYRIAQQARGYSLIYMVVLNGIVRYIITFKSLESILLYIPIVNSVYVMQQALDGKVTAFQIIIATLITLATSAWMIEAGAKKLSDEKLLVGVERAPKFQILGKGALINR